ncbi:MAG TPA: hypothetical protein VFA38_07225 [Nitrospirales bacterium]|nr:hypothetical protein [Nitrospirales bacterium]
MNARLLSVIAMLALAGCAPLDVCDVDDPKYGKDCYDCTRKAKLLSRDIDPHTNKRLSVEELTEQCLRDRGYVKQKQTG